MKNTILLVEDEQQIRQGISAFLMAKGYEIFEASNGEQAIQMVNDGLKFDLAIVDIMLPKQDGFDVLTAIRARGQFPVLMLTAMTDEATQLMSFEQQADDYMSKPFSLLILEKRIEVLLRRRGVHAEREIWTDGEVYVDFTAYTATVAGVPVDIKPKEIKLLKLLVEHPNQVLTRQQMLDQLWELEEAPYDRVIDVYVKNLRKKLQLTCIHTVKGVGYKYEEML